MTSAAAVLVTAALMRRLDGGRDEGAADLAVYRDQLQEVEREVEDQQIGEAEADLARVEIQRRMLAVAKLSDGDAGVDPISTGWRLRATVMVAATVVLGSVGLYAMQGSPEIPASPQRAASATAEASPDRTALQAQSAQLPKASPTGASTQATGEVDQMIARLAARLESQPKDPEGWRMLGWSYFNTKKYKEAAEAYARAVELQADSAPLISALGEALVRAGGGLVSAEARSRFKQVLALDPSDARARFFIGLAKEQGGDPKGAVDDWIALLGDSKPGDDWGANLRDRIVELATKAGIDVSGRLPGEKRLAALPKLNAPKGPTSEDVRNAQEMSAEDRQTMIRGMVDQLAERLEETPNDPDGWIRLIRSRIVLGERDAARASLKRALDVLSDEPASKARVAAAAQEMGVKQE